MTEVDEDMTPFEKKLWNELQTAQREYDLAFSLYREKGKVLENARHRWINATFSNPC